MRRILENSSAPHIEDEDGRSVQTNHEIHTHWLTFGSFKLGMLMFIVSNIVGSSIQITTLPLPVLSTLQAVEALIELYLELG